MRLNTVLCGVAAVILSLAATGTASAADAERGKELFVDYNCAACHGLVGQGGASGAKLAPNPPGVAAIEAMARTGPAEMPPYSANLLPRSDIEDIHAYLSTITAPRLEDIPLLQN